MENRGLLFIPDISGFTRFVNEVEIGHSRFIIQQLLEVLIKANDFGLEISEIEGDAILFYRFGDSKLNEIYWHEEKMFNAFHRQLSLYEDHRICHREACYCPLYHISLIFSRFVKFRPNFSLYLLSKKRPDGLGNRSINTLTSAATTFFFSSFS